MLPKTSCPSCGSGHVVRCGRDRGVQRLLCRGCGRKHRAGRASGRSFPPQMIARALGVFYEGWSFKRTADFVSLMSGIPMTPQTVRSWIHDYTRAAVSATQGKLGQGTDWRVYIVILERGRTWWVVKDEKTGHVLGSCVGRGDLESSARDAVKKGRVSAIRGCRRLTYQYVRPNRRWKRRSVPDWLVLEGFRKELRRAALASPLPRLHPEDEKSEAEEAEENFVKSLEQTARRFNRTKRHDVLQTYLDGWVIRRNYFDPRTVEHGWLPGQEGDPSFPLRSWSDAVGYSAATPRRPRSSRI